MIDQCRKVYTDPTSSRSIYFCAGCKQNVENDEGAKPIGKNAYWISEDFSNICSAAIHAKVIKLAGGYFFYQRAYVNEFKQLELPEEALIYKLEDVAPAVPNNKDVDQSGEENVESSRANIEQSRASIQANIFSKLDESISEIKSVLSECSEFH